MSAPAFTPGPWTWNVLEDRVEPHARVLAGAKSRGAHPVVMIHCMPVGAPAVGGDWGMSKADEALIAAAPSLYDALERCMFALGRAGANVAGGPGREEWESARATLSAVPTSPKSQEG